MAPGQISPSGRSRGGGGEPHHAAGRHVAARAAGVQQRPTGAAVRPACVHAHLRLLTVRIRIRTREAHPRRRIPQSATRQRNRKGERQSRRRGGSAAHRAGAVLAPAVDHLDGDPQLGRVRFGRRSVGRKIDRCAGDLATGLAGLHVDPIRQAGGQPPKRQRQQRIRVAAGSGDRGAGTAQRDRRRGHRHRLGGDAVQLDRSGAGHTRAQAGQARRERRRLGQLGEKQQFLQVAGAGALRADRERHAGAQNLDLALRDDQVPAVVQALRPHRAQELRAGPQGVAVVVTLRRVQQQPDVLEAAYLLLLRGQPEAVPQHRRHARRGHRRRPVDTVADPERHGLLADVDLPAVERLRLDGVHHDDVVAGGDRVDPVIAGHVDVADEPLAHGRA